VTRDQRLALCRQLKEARTARNIPRRVVAQALSKKLQAIYRWETGRATPTPLECDSLRVLIDQIKAGQLDASAA
jgi:DNA-binding transcriptional regulator YiaG